MEAKENKKKNIDISFITNLFPIPLKEKIFFVQNIGVMVRSGISLSEALKTLSKQTKNQRFSQVISEVQQKIEAGQSFGDALFGYPKIFNNLFINIIKAGEVSGKLEEALKDLHTQMKKDHDLISKVKSALTYPAVIIVAMLGIGSLMMIFVIPKLTALFKDMDAELPLATRVLITLSDLTISYLP